ncbi:serine/threonine protein phosphatase [bacterium]|nr:serine/threonine protein phosphatase [bacterium]
MHIYAIGDIHGHLELLKSAHHRIHADMALHGHGKIIHLGDLVDRGPNSCGVVEYLRKGMAQGRDWLVLKGNHDRLFTQFLGDPKWKDPGLRAELSWLHPKIGGAATLASYGVRNAADRPVGPVHADAMNAVPSEHMQFLEGLPTHFACDQAIFVHAGIRPGIALADQSDIDLLWIRKGFLEDTRDHGALIVHGHTAIDKATHYGNRLNMDSSAAYGGPLSAAVIEGRKAFLLTDTGRMPLLPV